MVPVVVFSRVMIFMVKREMALEQERYGKCSTDYVIVYSVDYGIAYSLYYVIAPYPDYGVVYC